MNWGDRILDRLLLLGPATTTHLALSLGTDRHQIRRWLHHYTTQHLVTQTPWQGRPVWALTLPALTALVQQAGYPPDVARWLRLSGYSLATRSHDLGVLDALMQWIRHSDPPHHGVLDWQGPGWSALPYAQWRGSEESGKIHRVQLAPDATLEYGWQDPTPRRIRALVEYDTGTERPPALERKASRYLWAQHPSDMAVLIITTGGIRRLQHVMAIFRSWVPEQYPLLGTLQDYWPTASPHQAWWDAAGRRQGFMDIAQPQPLSTPSWWGVTASCLPRDGQGRFAPGRSSAGPGDGGMNHTHML